jgi:hypothetical protein
MAEEKVRGRPDESKLSTRMAEIAGMDRRLDAEARRHQSGTVVGAGWKRDKGAGKVSRDRPIRDEDEKFGEKA